MNNYIKDNFNIVETYERNEFQEIKIGTSIEDSDEIVAINILDKSNFNNKLSFVLESSLQNLIYINDDNDKLSIITKYHEGASLDKYLKEMNLSMETKAELGRIYLEKIKKYKKLNNLFKYILVHENQIIINEEGLFLNELIIFSNNEPKTFKEVEKRIGKVLEKLLGRNSFVSKLISDEKQFDSIDKIFKAYKNEFIDSDKDLNIAFATLPDKSVESDNNETENISDDNVKKDLEKNLDTDTGEIELSSLEFIDEEKEEEIIENKRKENKDNKKILIIAAIILAFSLISFSAYKQLSSPNTKSEQFIAKIDYEKEGSVYHFSSLNEDNKNYNYEWKILSNDKVLKTYDKREIKFSIKNEGNYTITLRIKNNQGIWSDLAKEEIYYEKSNLDSLDDDNTDEKESTSDSLDDYNFEYISDNIKLDTENKKEGEKSIKFVFDDNNPKANFKINDLKLENENTLSFHIKSNKRNDINFQINGYNGNTEVFSKTKNVIPILENTWEMVSIDLKNENIDSIEIIINSKNSTIWLDNIDLSLIK